MLIFNGIRNNISKYITENKELKIELSFKNIKRKAMEEFRHTTI